MYAWWHSLIAVLLIAFLVISFLIWLLCTFIFASKIEGRFDPRLLDEINLIESGLNTDIGHPNSNSTQRIFEPSAPLEEIYTIEIAPDIYTADTKPPPYR